MSSRRFDEGVVRLLTRFLQDGRAVFSDEGQVHLRAVDGLQWAAVAARRHLRGYTRARMRFQHRLRWRRRRDRGDVFLGTGARWIPREPQTPAGAWEPKLTKPNPCSNHIA